MKHFKEFILFFYFCLFRKKAYNFNIGYLSAIGQIIICLKDTPLFFENRLILQLP